MIKIKPLVVTFMFFCLSLFCLACNKESDMTEPVDPSTPVDPSVPVDPSTPEDPTTPVDPTEPVEEISFSFSTNTLSMSIDTESEIPVISNGFDKNLITYSLDKNDIVEINDGKVIPINPGYVVVTGKYLEVEKTLEVYVFPVLKSALSIGEEILLNEEFLYETNNSEVLKVDDGKIVALQSGSAIIEITSLDGKLTNYTEIFVLQEAPIITAEKTVLCIGDETMIDVTNYDKEDLKWKVSNEDIVYLFEDFYAAAITAGKCTITATTADGLVSSSIEITVISDLPRFNIRTENVIAGDELELSLTEYNLDEVIIDFEEDYFEISISEVVILKTLKEGTTTVKVYLKEFPEFYYEEIIEIYSVNPLFNVTDPSITVGDKIKLYVINYAVGYSVEVSDKEIALYEDGFLTALKPGSTEIKVSLDDNKEIYSTIILNVLYVMPNISAVMPNILVDGETGFIITNIDKLADNDTKNYVYEVDDNSVASIDENGLLVGKKEGTVNVTVKHRNNSDIVGSTVVNVYASKNSVPSDVILITLEDTNGVLQAGEMFPTTIYSDYAIENYSMTTSNDLVLMVNSKGNILAVNAGVAQVNIYLKNNSNIKTVLTVQIVGIPNTNYIGRLIQIAEGEVGYVEGPNNDTKYGDWYGLPNEEWCAMFVSWCAKEAGISTDIIPKYCGCTAGMNWFKERNIWKDGGGEYKPKPGDIIFFTGENENVSSHTGIVIAYENNTVYTIEGNTSNMCAKRNYSVNSTSIRGYGLPNYPYYDGDIGSGDTGGTTDGEGESTT